MAFELNLQGPETAIADGPIPVIVSVKNTGGATIDAPNSKGPSAFSYDIFSSGDSAFSNGDAWRFLQIASTAAKLAAQPRFRPLPAPSSTIPLEPGGAATYRDDITSLLTPLLTPGRYLFQASYRDKDGGIAKSNRVPVEIVISRPVALAQALDAQRERLVLVEFHEQQDGAILIRKRESDRTLLDRFYDLHTFKASAVIQPSVALEAGHGVPPHWRWIAWLDGGSLYAGFVGRDRFMYPAGPIDLGLESAYLLPHGYVQGEGNGSFIVTGHANGRRRIRILTIPPGRNVSPRFVDVQLANLPDAVPCATMLCRDDGSSEIVFCWTLRAAGNRGVVQGRIDPATGAVTAAPRSFFTTPRDLVASHIAPVINHEQAGVFQALLAPPIEGGNYTFAGIDISGAAKHEERDLPPLDALEGKSVERWILPSNYFPRAWVLAARKDTIWATGDAKEWRQIAEGEIVLSSIGLWAFDAETVYCSWFDSVRGYRSSVLK